MKYSKFSETDLIYVTSYFSSVNSIIIFKNLSIFQFPEMATFVSVCAFQCFSGKSKLRFELEEYSMLRFLSSPISSLRWDVIFTAAFFSLIVDVETNKTLCRIPCNAQVHCTKKSYLKENQHENLILHMKYIQKTTLRDLSWIWRCELGLNL